MISADKSEVNQDRRDVEYLRAWENAPQAFKDRAARAGIRPEVDGVRHGVMELNEGFQTVSYRDPELQDSMVDILTEKWGATHRAMIADIVLQVSGPMQEEMNRQKSTAIARVAMYLVKGENGNILARIHGLMHSIPRLAATTGFASMRDSAKACGASVTWIKNVRDKWCAILDIPVPAEGQKKPEAKAKYQKIALRSHWRKRRFKK